MPHANCGDETVIAVFIFGVLKCHREGVKFVINKYNNYLIYTEKYVPRYYQNEKNWQEC